MAAVSGRLRFPTPAERTYEHLARGVLEHVTDGADAGRPIDEPATVRTRYVTKLWFGTVVTMEDATLDPGRSITWRHVDGPLTGSEETFAIEPRENGCVVRYRGTIRARHPLFRGPLERFFVAPMTRRVSMGALKQARRELAS